jgi:hypothetical protein
MYHEGLGGLENSLDDQEDHCLQRNSWSEVPWTSRVVGSLLLSWWRASQCPARGCPPLGTCFCPSFPSPYECAFYLARLEFCSGLLHHLLALRGVGAFRFLIPGDHLPRNCLPGGRLLDYPPLGNLGHWLGCYTILPYAHLEMGLSHNSEQQLCVLSRQGFNTSFQRCYAILFSTSWGRKWWRMLIALNDWLQLDSRLSVILASETCVHHITDFFFLWVVVPTDDAKLLIEFSSMT